MVSLNWSFDETNTGSAGASSGPIPAGDYLAEIISVAVEPARANPDNKMLVLEWTIESGRRVWDRLNLWHPTSQKAIEIATERFNQLGVAVGLGQISDTDQLILKRAMVSIGIQATNPQYNEVRGYAPPASVNPPINAPAPAPAPVQAGPPQPAPAQAASAPGTYPWGS